MRKDSFENFIIIGVISLTLLFSSIGLQPAVNLLFFLLCGLLCVYDRKLLLLLYIIILPTNGFIDTDYTQFGIFHVSYIVEIFALVGAIIEVSGIKPYKATTAHQETFKIKRIALYLTLFLLIYGMYRDHRLFLIGFADYSESHLYLRHLRSVIRYVPLLIIAKLSVHQQYDTIIRKGFIISLIVISLSIVFSEQLHQLGISTQDAGRLSSIEFIDSYIRRAGVFTASGDVNTASGFLVVGAAYLLLSGTHWVSKRLKNTVIIFILLALIAGASRTAFVGFGLVLFYFLVASNMTLSLKIRNGMFVFAILIMFFYLGLFEPVMERFDEVAIGEGHLNPESRFGRVGGWVFYLQFIFSDFSRFLWGTAESIYGGTTTGRAAHNAYIQIVYHTGIIPLLLLLYLFYKYMKLSLKTIYNNQLYAMFIPLVLTLLFVSDFGVLLAFIVAISALPNEHPYKPYSDEKTNILQITTAR